MKTRTTRRLPRPRSRRPPSQSRRAHPVPSPLPPGRTLVGESVPSLPISSRGPKPKGGSQGTGLDWAQRRQVSERGLGQVTGTRRRNCFMPRWWAWRKRLASWSSGCSEPPLLPRLLPGAQSAAKAAECAWSAPPSVSASRGSRTPTRPSRLRCCTSKHRQLSMERKLARCPACPASPRRSSWSSPPPSPRASPAGTTWLLLSGGPARRPTRHSRRTSRPSTPT
mmetsp:Transcript_19229/g.43547  ORF Transcript_19229/g.43547 Transcript_19229/m.43547 type:complete len:224 (-) Transcript_19229:451-1122(-)